MASLSFFALAVLCFVTVALGQIMPPDDDAPRVIIHGILLADTFTDGITVVHDGDISGTSMNVRGNLFGGDATFVSVTASDTTVGELTVTDLATLKGLNTTMLEVTGDSTFGGNVAINGSITAGASNLNMTSVTDLTVRGDANFEQLLRAQSNIQVGADINVGGTSHFFGDALANMTATVEESLLVNGDASSDALFVSGRTNATSAQVDERSRITELNVAENVDVGGNLYLGGDLSVDQSAAFKLALSANEASLMGNFHIGVNATVGGNIKATTGQFSNVDVKGSTTVSGTLTTTGYILVAGETTVGGDVEVEGDISAENMISAVAGDFQELDVDTATIVSLTSTFVTSTTFDSDAATVSSTFMVNGATTVDVLTVESTSTLNDVTADSVETDDLEATTVTVAMLTVTGDATLNTMTVSTMLMAGRPTETVGWFASFEDAFVDSLHSVNSSGQVGMVGQLNSDKVNYTDVTGRDGTFNQSMITTATITRLNVDMADIDSTTADEAQITNTTGDLITTASLFINDTGSLDHLFAETLRTQTLEGTYGDFDVATSVSAVTNFLTSTNSTIQNLTSSTANITWLQSNTGTVTRLTSVNAWFQNASSNSLVYTNANFSALTSTNFNASLMYNVTGGSSTNWFFAQTGKINETEARTLYVTDSAFFQNLTLNGNTSVEGSASFQRGFISGEALVSTLTVVGDTSFAELSVTGPAFLTDLWVKRVTITDSFNAQTAELTTATTGATTSTGAVQFAGTFNVSSSDSLLKGNLVVQGTTQFQTGSFSRIGTAVITTTDMEAFNMDIANGLFGAITVDDLTVTRGAIFDRSIQLAPLRDSTSGSDFSFFSTINPINTRVLTAEVDGTQFFVTGQTLFHSGLETVDQLVITNPTNPGRAALRITGDGQLDFLDGSLYFRNLDIGGGVVFENEQNVAWIRPGVATTRTLVLGTSTQWFSYSDLIDRDLVEPGTWIDPARFSEPSNAGQTDLLTLSAGQYRVSGNVEIMVNSPASADSIVVVTAGVDAFLGTQSSGVASWTADCVASFGVITGTNYGGSCFFSGILTVDEGEVMTLRTKALWNFSSATLANTLVVDPASTLIVEELFDRTSQNLS